MDIDMGVVERRTVLAELYSTLPPYASAAFWSAVEDPTLPLEILVKILRTAIASGDEQGRRRIMEWIIVRTQATNLLWAQRVLQMLSLQADERSILARDLCADLHECMMRALADSERLFWEENFLHCLYFERKHVYRSFLTREGLWYKPSASRGMRIPRTLVASLDRLLQPQDRDHQPLEIEDEGVQRMFLSVEQSDLLQTVLCLPDKLKAVILLIFWEGRSEKEAAQVLSISDRTVRNRLRGALKLLRSLLSSESEGSFDA
ncbi:MAG TPA: sigma-70 family RNA polymerase sigma factor [Ktedonobacteraceae bacterium]|jgi:DNA-directed RNA polymerase specialized sigma24 family protein